MLCNRCSDFFSGRDVDEDDSKNSKRCIRENINPSQKIRFTVSPESIRFLAYVMFWFFISVAITVTKILVVPRLAAGPPAGQEGCLPFNNGREGFEREHGFDFETQNHLTEYFGFANICTNWDYTPSREITSIFYTFFEFFFVIYVILNIITISLAHKKGLISGFTKLFSQVVFPIELISLLLFRQIFVNIAYENVNMHTYGFLCMQIFLTLQAIENVLYILDAKIEYKVFGGLTGTRVVVVVYIISNFTISCLKMFSTYYIVFYGGAYSWYKEPSMVVPGVVVGQVVDAVWMIFNTVMPLIISYIRARSEKPLIFDIDMHQPVFINSGNDLDSRAKSV